MKNSTTKVSWMIISFTVSFLAFSLIILTLMRFFHPYSAPPVIETVLGDELEPAYTPTDEDALTILFIGTETKNTTPGAYILARFDPVRGSFLIAAIPVRTVVPNNGKIESLDEIYAYGGASYTKGVLESALGISIDRYVRVDSASFIKAADSIGSVIFALIDDLPISENGASMILAGGTQLLDGRKVAAIIKADDTPAEDRYNRIARLSAEIVNQRMDIMLSTAADQVFGRIINLVDTDISYTDYFYRKEAAVLMAETPRSPASVVELSGEWNTDGTYTLSDTFLARIASEMG